MAQTVVGIFDSSTEAQNAVESLSNNGFTIDQVDLTYNSQGALEDESDVSGYRRADDDFGNKINRFFKSLFDNGDESSKYSRVARNAAIVTVIADSSEKAALASQILDDAGAIDVDERAKDFSERERSPASTTTLDYDRDRQLNLTDNDMDRDYSEGTDKSIPIMEEHLQVGKREVDRGTVRVRSRIVERPVEEHVRLREERVIVERNAVNRPATEGDLSTFSEGEIEIKQRAEVPVVNKEARIVEEVRLNRDVTERDEVIRDTVRRTEVDIDEDVADDVSTSRQSKRDKDLLD